MSTSPGRPRRGRPAHPKQPRGWQAPTQPARRGGQRNRAPRMEVLEETSAGGLVLDTARAHAAVIGRLDRRGALVWSLPKGHIEAGESARQTAVREVAEETGVSSQVLDTLGTIDYWFIAAGRKIHKTVHHFLLEWRGGELSDDDVEVTQVAWVPLAELEALLAYPDERRLVSEALRALRGPDGSGSAGDGGRDEPTASGRP